MKKTGFRLTQSFAVGGAVAGLLLCAATAGAQPAAHPAEPGYAAWASKQTWNRSWIAFDWSSLQGHLVEGEKIGVTLEYYLDPAENYKTTTLHLAALGPRIPKPGVPQPVSFDNTQHIWYGEQSVEIQPGRGKHTFAFTVPKNLWQNWLLFLGYFVDSQGHRFPWDVRAEARYTRAGGYFELETDRPGNLFTYPEPVRLFARLKAAAQPGVHKTLRYEVFDATGAQVAQGSVPFTVTAAGQRVPIDLHLTRRGTFLLRATVDGWETRETTFCRIPDLLALTGGKQTRFGMTVHAMPWLGAGTDEVLDIARRLGLTTCRAFTEWANLEPGPGVYALPYYDHFFAAAHKRGIDTVITIYNPPAWVQPRGQFINYRAFDCDLKAFADMVRTVSTRYRGEFWGWEWLNEITPGGPPDYVKAYLKLCRTGTETARAVDPKLQYLLAGGLWPRGFRLDMLNAGVGKYIDVLPIHYANGAAVQEARGDLDTFGYPKVQVWDDESAGELIQWKAPGLALVENTVQSKWVLTQWSDELAAGCRRIIYFGGEGSPIGDWDYLFTDYSPRPVAATLAVLVSKLFLARPLGTLRSPGKATTLHVFDRQGKAVIVASSGVPGGEDVPLALGPGPLRITDYQGNETTVPVHAGVATVDLKQMPCFIEGADLDTVEAYLVPSIATASGAGGAGAESSAMPQVTRLRGQPGYLRIRLWNPYNRRLAGTVTADLPPAWLRDRQVSFSLSRGQTKNIVLPLTIPAATKPAVYPHTLTVRYEGPKLPVVTKPFEICVISRESVGNLLSNGGFEKAAPDGTTPVAWSGTNAKLVSSAGLGLGLGKRVLKFENAPSWAHYGQQLSLTGGKTYLYTAWVWNGGMEGGSNINQVMQDGTERDLYDQQVINIGGKSPYWQVFTCRYQAPPDLKTAAFVPVARGSGWAMYDNVSVTRFEGSDFAAQAWRTAKPLPIDGSLAGWNQSCPIPLIGQNQLHIVKPGYKWTPQNLNGVAYLAWDAKNLYVTVQVLDDVHHPAGQGETVTEGDSVILAFDPTGRGPDAASRSVEYYLSDQRPGSGSGRYTLWRTRAHSGGRPAGHVARDSSVYDVTVKQDKGGCVYQVRIPFSELDFTPSFGAKLGFSIQLNDNDGAGLAAHMNWGGGLWPAWSPASFGVVTLVE